MAILVTGGTGYIGSHTCVELLKNNYDIVLVDNLSNSKREVIDKIKMIADDLGKPDVNIPFYQLDLCEKDSLRTVFQKEKIDAVIHFAGVKAVGESVKLPLKYYENNTKGTINLLQVMNEFGVKKIVFSSSATVYTGALGRPPIQPLSEKSPLAVTNPYGCTKLMIEGILRDLHIADPDWNIIILRYFNPIGAHESGLIGEDPDGIPNNLMPFIVQVASGKIEQLYVFGDDYDTKDGTGVRDYIHVMDLAEGHVLALKKINHQDRVYSIYNLGTGQGYSVLDIVNTFKVVNQVSVQYAIAPRRDGDVDMYFADPLKAERELGWKATRDLEDMCRDSWNFQMKNLEKGTA